MTASRHGTLYVRRVFAVIKMHLHDQNKLTAVAASAASAVCRVTNCMGGMGATSPLYLVHTYSSQQLNLLQFITHDST